jgi:Ras-related GTP-binding protein A/B
VLFERTTFLVVTSVTSRIGDMNPDKTRFERLSNIIKTFKQSLAKHTGLPKSSPQFIEVAIKVPKFNLFIAKFTANTYILVVTPPGEATFNGAVLNTKIAVEHFEKMDGLGKGAGAGGVAEEGAAGEGKQGIAAQG